MKVRNPEAICGNCVYYIHARPQEQRPSECRVARPVPLLVPIMVPVPGNPIMVPGRNHQGGPQMKQVLSAEFPMFTPVPEFWCGQHPDFWKHTPERVRPPDDVAQKDNPQVVRRIGAATVDFKGAPDAA